MNQPLAPLTCPKCAGQMRAYERNGVTIDQCGDCRGIFLDRGELDHLLDAESRYNQTPPTPPSGYPSDNPQPQYGGHYGEDKHHGHRGRDPRRRRSFLSELFD